MIVTEKKGKIKHPRQNSKNMFDYALATSCHRSLVMNKNQLLRRLREIRADECTKRGLYQIVQMLIFYFSKPEIPQYEETGIVLHLDKHIVLVMDVLRASRDPRVKKIRRAYLEEMEADDIPSVTEIRHDGVARILLHSTLSELVPLILQEPSPRLAQQLEGYFCAQDLVVRQQIDRFNQEVYQRGLGVLINRETSRGMSGIFGSTMLWSHYSANVGITLARFMGGEEVSVTFLGSGGMKYDPGFGIISVRADLSTTLSMFNDVLTSWPEDPGRQRKVFKKDDKVVKIIG
jgi:hypothetical protein